MNATWAIAALTTGLVGSLHCVGMCGPLAMALPVGRLPPGQRKLAVSLYHGARVAAYAGLGVAIGTVGQGLLLLGLQRPLSIGAGLFLIVWTLLLQGQFAGLTASKSLHRLAGPMRHFLQHPSPGTFAGLGFLNGLLPCGFVYVSLAGAITTGHAVDSALYMALFGVGTIPALLAVRSVPALVGPGVRRRFVRLMPLVAVGLGLLLMVRGFYPASVSTGTPGDIPVCHGAAVGVSQRR